MEFLGSKKNTIFIGQAVEVPGTAMSNTLKRISKKKLLELPVAEEMQMGVTLGLAMDGNIPISIYPRWNFLLYAVNQMINHVDKFTVMAGKKIKPKITNTRICISAHWKSIKKNEHDKNDVQHRRQINLVFLFFV